MVEVEEQLIKGGAEVESLIYGTSDSKSRLKASERYQVNRAAGAQFSERSDFIISLTSAASVRQVTTMSSQLSSSP